MAKKTAETGLLDDGAGFGVDVSGLDTRPDRGDPALLSRQDGAIDFLKLWSDLTGDQDPRQVTFVGRAGGPPVDQHEVGLADPRPGVGPGVGEGRVGADGDDRRE